MKPELITFVKVLEGDVGTQECPHLQPRREESKLEIDLLLQNFRAS